MRSARRVRSGRGTSRCAACCQPVIRAVIAGLPKTQRCVMLLCAAVLASHALLLSLTGGCAFLLPCSAVTPDQPACAQGFGYESALLPETSTVYQSVDAGATWTVANANAGFQMGRGAGVLYDNRLVACGGTCPHPCAAHHTEYGICSVQAVFVWFCP